MPCVAREQKCTGHDMRDVSEHNGVKNARAGYTTTCDMQVHDMT